MSPYDTLRAVVSLAACAVFGAFGAHDLRAQVVPDTVVRVDPVRVEAARAVTTAGGASALEVEPDSLALSAAPSMEELMRALPLVQVRTNSRGEAQFSLRGSGADARQVAVLLDGVPLNIGWDDRADLSVLPAGAATSVTLTRGLPSVLHGPNVLGGVVEVNVAQGSGTASDTFAEARASVDQTGAWAAGGSAGTPFELQGGVLSLRAGGGLRARDGVPLAGGGSDLRSNTDASHADGFVAARFVTGSGAWASFSGSAFSGKRGIAAELHSESPRHWRYPDVSRRVAALSLGTGHRPSPLGGVGDIELSVGDDRGSTSIRSYADASYSDVVDTEDSDDRTLTLRLLADQEIGRTGELRTAFSTTTTHHDEVLSFGSVRNGYTQRIWSAGAETAWRIGVPSAAFPLMRLSVGGAFDGASTPRSGDKPALGSLNDWGARVGATAVSADGVTSLHAGASRRARFPALRELYSGALGRFQPNPSLRPEVLTAAEAGVTTEARGMNVQAVAFFRSLDDAIEQVSLGGGLRQRVNLGTSRSYGLELLTSAAVAGAHVSADLTVQDVRLYRDGKQLDERPEYQPAVLAGATVSLRMPLRIEAEAATRFVGSQRCTDPNGPGQLELDPSARLDAALSRGVRGFGGRNVALRLAAENVLDSAIFDQCGLPQPGRTVELQVRIR